MLSTAEYAIVVQCEIVKQRCSGFLCEHAFTHRIDCFAEYAGNEDLRFLPISCGGCCGRATLRKLQHAVKLLKQKENISTDQIVVHLASCVAFESHHGPECPHKEYLSKIVSEKVGLRLVYGTRLSPRTEARRKSGLYPSR
ncbi:MAG: CGGC domain-containing protein [Lentisphaerae bacterium]|nr:MAG: CGGC domain-containing protein [Lentisphaerota bacterium]